MKSNRSDPALHRLSQASKDADMRRLWLICWARLLIAAILAISLSISAVGDDKPIYALTPNIIAMAYALVALAAIWILSFEPLHWRQQLSAQLIADLLLVGLLVSSLGGSNGGYVILFAMPIAFAAALVRLNTVLVVCSITVFILFFDAYRDSLNPLAEVNWFLIGLQGMFGFGFGLLLHGASRATAHKEQLIRQNLLRERLTQEIDEQHLNTETQGWLVLDAAFKVQILNAPARSLAWQAGVLLELGTDLSQLPAVKNWLDATRQSDEISLIWPPISMPVNDGEVSQQSTSHLFVKASRLAHFEHHTALHLELSTVRQAKLQQLQLAAMGRLSASIAHEIRNPLAAISQAAELLQESARESNAQTHTTIDAQAPLPTMVLNNVQRIDRIVHQLLGWSRGVKANAVRLDYAKHVMAAAQEVAFGLRIPQGVLTLDDVPSTLPAAQFDTDHLYQIIANLLSNAARFASLSPASIRVTLKPRGDHVSLWVQDDGPPVDARIAQHLFEPFQSASLQGTGLGLFLCREYAQANHGSIELMTHDAPLERYTKAFVLNMKRA